MSEPCRWIASGGVLSGRASRNEEDAAYRKANWHITPVILLAYILAFLDRINVGYTQLQRKQGVRPQANV